MNCLRAILLACALLACSAVPAQTTKETVNRALESLRRGNQPTQTAPNSGTNSGPTWPGLSGGRHPRAEPIDVLGVQLGMSMAEATETLKKSAPGMTLEVATLVLKDPAMSFPAYLIGRTGEAGNARRPSASDRLVVWFAAPPSPPRVIMIGRALSFASGGEIERNKLLASLRDKYGPWHQDNQIGTVSWNFNRGDPPAGGTHPCGRTVEITLNYDPRGFTYESRLLRDQPAIYPECGQSIEASLTGAIGNPQLVRALAVSIIDHPATLAARNATLKQITEARAGALSRQTQSAKERKVPAI